MNKKNRHPIRTFNLIKAILIVIHIAALLLFLTGVTFIYSNEHLKVGIAEFNAGVYEDSPVFLDQYNQDIQYVFDYLDNKDIGVFLLDNNEVTIKRFNFNGGSIILKAANPKYEDRKFKEGEIKILGKVLHSKVLF